MMCNITVEYNAREAMKVILYVKIKNLLWDSEGFLKVFVVEV